MKGLPYSIQNTSHMSDFFFLFKQPKDVFKGDLCSKKNGTVEVWGQSQRKGFSRLLSFNIFFKGKKLINQISNV